MDLTISLASALTMFGSMLLLALLPSVSVMLVSARSASLGFSHGVATTIGIVVGDAVYIVIAVYGLTILISATGQYFYLLRLLGGMYLIWLGIHLWRSGPGYSDIENKGSKTHAGSFAAGFLITLGDQKVVLFYLGFFPAFFNLAQFTLWDTSLVILLALSAIALPKLAYAFFAQRASQVWKDRAVGGILNRIAATIIMMVGLTLILFFE